jgi:hypothetical protein
MMEWTECLQARLGFNYVTRIYDGIGDKPRFEPYYNSESVLNLTSDSDQENMIFLYRTLGAIVKDLDNICDVVQSDPYYIKDKLLPAVSTVLWAEQFSERIKERLAEGAFDGNEPIKKEMDVITIYLDYSCQKVGTLLNAGLDAILEKKETLLKSARESIGAQMLQIEQQMQKIYEGCENFTALLDAARSIEPSVNSSSDLAQALRSLELEVADSGLGELPALAEQYQKVGDDLLDIVDSFDERRNIQEQLGTLIQRTSGYQNVPYTDLLELNRTIEPPVPVRSESSETSEGSGPQTGIFQFLRGLFQNPGQ